MTKSLTPPAARGPTSPARRWTIRALFALLIAWQVIVTIAFTHLVAPATGLAQAPQEAGVALILALTAWAIGSIGLLAIIFRIGKTRDPSPR